jgi:hypothetical protein
VQYEGWMVDGQKSLSHSIPVFRFNQCLISFFFLKIWGGRNWQPKKIANATHMQRDSFGKNNPNFARFRQQVLSFCQNTGGFLKKYYFFL